MVKNSYKRRLLKVTALFFVFNITLQAIFPTMAWALTAGPSQPEYTSFEPVATTNMVNEFSGQFTYNLPVVNVPGPDGSGYAMSLSYHSNVSPEEEASWVGYGWSLNPGAINRDKQGTPDDFKSDANPIANDQVSYWNKTNHNYTVTMNPTTNVEVYSFDLGLPVPIPSFRYNNYRGFGSQLSIQNLPNPFGSLVSLNYTVSGEEPHSFSASLNTGVILSAIKLRNAGKQKQANRKADPKSTKKFNDFFKPPSKTAKKASSVIRSLSSTYGLSSFGEDNRVSTVTAYNGRGVNTGFNLGIYPSGLHIGFEMGVAGTVVIQDNEPVLSKTMIGFLYGGATDYSVEKEANFNKRDRYLSIPHQTPDVFTLTGEGLAGSFQLTNPNITKVTPIPVLSPTDISNSAVDVSVGQNFGIGFNAGFGHHRLELLNPTGVTSNFGTPTSMTPFFRFKNDLGGNVIFTANKNDNNTYAPTVGSIETTYTSATNLSHLQNRPGSSSYVGYATVGDRQSLDGHYSRFRSFTYDPDLLEHVTYNDAIKNRIAELYTVNESGNTYVYGLSAFVADEKAFSYNMNFSNTNADVENNYRAWRNGEASNIAKVGEEHSKAYPSTHLLTQITTPDYIDRTFDGFTSDDFGGWTKFNYRPAEFYKNTYQNKVANRDKWYRWRFPYTGYYYDKGEISDPRDDIGSMQSGSKEIYYLKTIETKTHVAFFITNETNVTIQDDKGSNVVLAGSGNDRTDACSAAGENSASQDKTSRDETKKLEKLERIVIYAKAFDNTSSDIVISGKPLTTVHFDYYADGSSEILLKNLPNSSYLNSGVRGGKLTLKKVWFEHEGIVNAKIAPYEFKYEYKDLESAITNQSLKDKYPEVVGFASILNLEANKAKQNPNYSDYISDGWGANYYNGVSQFQNMRPWVFQGNYPEGTVFDPGAWQLKQIKLPSGGEILVQYEQSEYLYVQNKRALGMVSIRDVDSEGAQGSKFYLKTEELGLVFDPGNISVEMQPKINAYVQTINNYLANEKIFFKFLYRLMDQTDAASIENCASDFIEGYAQASAGIDQYGIYIEVYKPSAGSGQKNYTLPFDVCKSYVTRRKAGLGVNGDCSVNPELDFSSDPLAAVKSVAQRAITDLNKVANNNCRYLNENYSYFRVPTYNAKRGGGSRVKRILMYDQGYEENTEVLYGTEYFYVNEDGTSSGVATNEPSNARDENALVSSLTKRNDPTWGQRVIGGIDRENFEGPMGEALLPGPSIGYRRVVTQNIHTGKTGTGFRVSEFLTAKEYPFKMRNSEIEESRPSKIYVPAGPINFFEDRKSVAQTYQFTVNNMHGQAKRVAIFSGKYQTDKLEKEYVNTFEETHEYYEPGEKVKVMDQTGVVQDDYLGREESVTFEAREVDDEQIDGSLQMDFDFGIFLPAPFPIPQFSACPYLNYSLRTLKSVVINKVVSYTALSKRTTTTQDGIVHINENKVFSKYNGMPIVTASYDGYDGFANLPADGVNTPHDGTYMNYTVPAHFVYNNMGQKAQNQRRKITGSFTQSTTSGITTVNVGSANVSTFVKGDLLGVKTASTSSIFYVKQVATAAIELQLVSSETALTGNVTGIEILNSGYTNQLNDVTAKISTYGVKAIQNPLSSGSINPSLTNVISVSVDTYSDAWGNAALDAQYGMSEITNDFQTGRKGKWRLKSSFTYKDQTQDAYTSTNKVYNNAGKFSNAFEGFNYSSTPSGKWINTNTVNLYSPHGNALEEQNALSVKSCAVFGYAESVPVLIAKNAPYSSVLFESFEDKMALAGVDNTTAHSGRSSFLLPNGSSSSNLLKLTLDEATKAKGLDFKFWAKATPKVLGNINQYVTANVTNGSGVLSARLTPIAKVGEWVLFESVVKGLSTLSGTLFTFDLTNTAEASLWIDDVRIQPYDSEMICYVYDRNNLRLLVTFDDQHFGMYYQYNAEGKLVRKLIETERGMKTVSETQYNVPLSNKQ